MRKIVMTLILLSALTCHAQIALKAMLYKPTGELGMVFEKKIAFEIMYMNEFDGKWRSRAGLSIINLKTRLDTFPSYAVVEDGDGIHVAPGYQIFKNPKIIYVFCGRDLRFTEDKKISPYIGMDVIVGALGYDSEEYYETIESGSTSGDGGIFGGLRFRAGLQYQLTDKLGVFAEASLAAYLLASSGINVHHDFGAGLHYIFNP